MKIVHIRTVDLSSMSVYPDEVKAVQLDPGEVIWCKGERHAWETPVALIVDRLGWKGTDPKCTMIRQVLKLDAKDQIWGQLAVFTLSEGSESQRYAKITSQSRAWARNREYPLLTVPGGIIPLVKDGYVAIPDFHMSGTKWRIVPWGELEKAIPGAFCFQYSSSDEE